MNLNEATAQPSESAAAKSQPTLHDLECIIERGKATFLEVGDALHEIKSRNLYKNTHPTWAAYAKERWGFPGNTPIVFYKREKKPKRHPRVTNRKRSEMLGNGEKAKQSDV